MFFVQTEVLNHIGNKRLENIAVASKAFYRFNPYEKENYGNMVSDIWNIVESGIKTWRPCDFIGMNVLNICRENWVCIFMVLVIGILMMTSIISINRFLRDKKRNNHPPKIKMKKAIRANKLSSEFLLAYIFSR